MVLLRCYSQVWYRAWVWQNQNNKKKTPPETQSYTPTETFFSISYSRGHYSAYKSKFIHADTDFSQLRTKWSINTGSRETNLWSNCTHEFISLLIWAFSCILPVPIKVLLYCKTGRFIKIIMAFVRFTLSISDERFPDRLPSTLNNLVLSLKSTDKSLEPP